MSKEIKAIGTEAVHRICSGQVVLNLAMAIKELVENSIDANSTIIDVRLRECGSELIEVVDNGTGVHPDNFEALTLKHHTSKLSDFSDLVNVNTFGFRGEALSSLCALSDLSVITRYETESLGSKILFDNHGHIKDIIPTSRQVGTTISLSNIFYTLPVRHKEFHRNLRKEFSKMTQLLSAYCLIAAGVKITCSNQTKKGGRLTLLSTQGSKTVRENISCIFGSKQLNSVVEIVECPPDEDILEEIGIINVNSEMFKLNGFISSCEHGCGRSSTDRQFYYINSRPCEPVKIIKIVNELYHQFNQHQFPFVVLNILVAKESIDINVTPDKRLIFLQNEKLLIATIKSSLLKLYENVPSTYKLNNIALHSTTSTTISTLLTKSSVSSLSSKWRSKSDQKSFDVPSIGSKRSIDVANSTKHTNKQLKLDNIFQRSKNVENPMLESSSNDRTGTYECSVDSTIVDNDTEIELEEKITNENAKPDILMKGESDMEEDLIDNLSFSLIKSKSLDLESSINEEPTDVEPNTIVEQNYDGEIDKGDRYEIDESDQDEINDSDRDEIDNTIEKLPSPSDIKVIVDTTKAVETYKSRKCVNLNITMKELKRRVIEKYDGKSIEQTEFVNKFHTEIDPNKNQVAESELSKEITKDMFSKMEIVGQFNLGFIITRLGPDLFIIDQHATDEKYNFEILQQTTTLKNQKLVIPQCLELTTMNECILLENLEILQKNGFEFEINKDGEPTKRVKLSAIPVSRNWQFGKQDIDELLFMLQDSPNTSCRPSRVRAMFASRACRKSVMIGTALNFSDMRRLVNHMGEIEQPWRLCENQKSAQIEYLLPTIPIIKANYKVIVKFHRKLRFCGVILVFVNKTN